MNLIYNPFSCICKKRMLRRKIGNSRRKIANSRRKIVKRKSTQVPTLIDRAKCRVRHCRILSRTA